MIDTNFPQTLNRGDVFFVGYKVSGKRYKLYKMSCGVMNDGIWNLWAATKRIESLPPLFRSTTEKLPVALDIESRSLKGDFAAAVRSVFSGPGSFRVWVERRKP